MKSPTRQLIDYKSGFLDTNILLYAHDKSEPAKAAVAWQLIEDWLTGREIWLSTQVLQEYAQVLLAKFHFPPRDVLELVGIYSRMRLFTQTGETVARAVELADLYQLQYYDALIVAAAEASNCEVLFSEDMQDGQTIAGVKIVNPFKG